MLLSRFKRVAILAPAGTTGGPEAIHQLAHSLNTLGVRCDIAYFGAANQVQIEIDRIICRPPGHRPSMDYYRSYHPQVSEEIPVGPDTLAILPEAVANHHVHFKNCGVALWWLSVDNALRAQPALREPDRRAQLFGRSDLIHLHQSVYAREWLRANGAKNLYELGDYTSDAFTGAPARTFSPRPIAAYNANKGADIGREFFSENVKFEGLGLRGYAKTQLKAIFSERLIYVDFGHFPGKDRMPREAAVSGSVVFINRQGAGEYYDDFPLPDFFKFTAQDVTSGSLQARLDAVLADPEGYWAQQEFFRALVIWEKAQFHDQVMRLWGLRRMP